MQLAIRLSKKKKSVTTTTNASRPVFYKEKESGQALFCYFRLFYFFILSRLSMIVRVNVVLKMTPGFKLLTVFFFIAKS